MIQTQLDFPPAKEDSKVEEGEESWNYFLKSLSPHFCNRTDRLSSKWDFFYCLPNGTYLYSKGTTQAPHVPFREY